MAAGSRQGSSSKLAEHAHEMQHHTRSTYGNSKTAQGRKVWGTPIAGIGQGNGLGPQI